MNNNFINIKKEFEKLPIHLSNIDNVDYGDYFNISREAFLLTRSFVITCGAIVFRDGAAIKDSLYHGALINGMVSDNFNYMLKSGNNYKYYFSPSEKGAIQSSCGSNYYNLIDLLTDAGLKLFDINLINILDDVNDLNDVELLNVVNYVLILDHYNDYDPRGVSLKESLRTAGVNPFLLLDIYKKAGRDCGDVLKLFS